MVMTAEKQNEQLNKCNDTGNNFHTTLEQEVA